AARRGGGPLPEAGARGAASTARFAQGAGPEPATAGPQEGQGGRGGRRGPGQPGSGRRRRQQPAPLGPAEAAAAAPEGGLRQDGRVRQEASRPRQARRQAEGGAAGDPEGTERGGRPSRP